MTTPRYYAGDRITITLDLEVFDGESFVADADHGPVTIALLSDDEKTTALAAVSAIDDATIPGRVSATWEAVATGSLVPGYYRPDAQRTAGPLTYDRPRILIGAKRP
jgi:hypothetical protein